MTSSSASNSRTPALSPSSHVDMVGRRGVESTDDVAVPPLEQRSLVSRLSEEVAMLRRALEASHHRIATLEVEASEDPSSGLLNRRAFMREIDKAIAFQARYRMTCGIVLVDIEGIGTVTAGQGHAAANGMLRRLGGIFRAGIRSCDVAARTGNEQFGAVLWNSAFAECASRIERLERTIALDEPGLASLSAMMMIEPGARPDELMRALEAALVTDPIRR